MSKKQKMVELSEEDYEKLVSLAEEATSETYSKDDDAALAALKQKIEEDLGTPTETTDNSRWELDENPVIDNVLRALRRERRAPDGSWYRPKGIKPIVNDVGVADIQNFLQPYLSKDIALGNIKEDDAHQSTFWVMDNFLDTVMMKHKEWELVRADRHQLVSMIHEKVWMMFSRAVDEGERKYRQIKYPVQEQYKHDEVRPDEVYGGSGGQPQPIRDEVKI